MTAEEAAEWGKTLSFEKVWAALMETDKKFQEMVESSKESSRETDRKFQETDRKFRETEKLLDRMGVNVGGLNRSIGELVETLVAARLWEKFPEYGLQRAYQRIPIYDDKNVIKTDIDILLLDTAMCMAVEVKRELNRKDEVDQHLKRMSLIRQYPPFLITPDKQLLGAMAGGVVDPDTKDYAYRAGFFVLELAGESVQLITPPEGFEPGKW